MLAYAGRRHWRAMTCEMQLAGMAPSPSLSPGGAMADSQWSAGRGIDAFGVSDREAERFLAPTARLLYLMVTIEGMEKLDKL